ncbi:MAG: PAS domain S-box protein [Gemmataceae bacterium]|nr:PAS domain S-box protein [Gemmataceae bacterium]
MDTDRNLRFGVLALEAGFIDGPRFVEACQLWSAHRTGSLGDLLVERGWIEAADRDQINHLLDRKPLTARNDATVDLHTPVGEGSCAHQPDTNPRTLVHQSEVPEGTRQTSTVPAATAERRYNPIHMHASGGMGQVWLTRDTWLDRDVALKELRPEVADSSTVVTRFLREARITGQLEHPGIVPVYELSKHADSGQPFYTMRFVRGRTLTDATEAFHARRAEGQVDMLEFVSLLGAFVTVCNTIAYAHSRGIIHRDLKGNNVIVGEFGEVIVLDWGLAKRVHRDDDDGAPSGRSLSALPDQTMAGDLIGTPAYMAPEQANGFVRQIDHRTDIYGLGAMLYEILTGQPPHTGTDTMEVLTRVIQAELIAPRQFWPEVPSGLEAVCLKALARLPVDRYQSASEVGQAVQQWQETQRRQAEDALRRQTEILQSILNSMSEAVMVADRAGRLLLINPAAERLLGIRPTDATMADARGRYELFRCDGVTPCATADIPLARAIAGQVVDDAELIVRSPIRPDGFWVSANARPLKDERGSICGGVVVIRDITERKRIEEELRRSRERFELAVRGSQDGLWDWDLETNVVYFSPRWKAIIGYQDHEIAHHIDEWDRRLHPDERETVLAANHAHIDGETPHYEYEYRLRHKDGSYRWILARGVALRDAHGNAYRMAGSHVDVTERRAAEEALREVEESYRAVQAALPVGILIVDGAGGLRTLNASAERMLGRNGDELRGHAGLEGALREDGTHFPVDEQPIAVTLRTGAALSGAIVGLPRPDGGVRRVSVSTHPLLRRAQTTPYGVVAILEDVSERLTSCS